MANVLLAHEGIAAEPVRKVGEPPDRFFELVREKHREKARAFYRKHLDTSGLQVAAAGEVEDRALLRTGEIVSRMLAGRPDILEAMIRSGMYLVIIGKDQVYTDMPEYSDHPNPAFQNERVRGTGGKPTSFGEENLLSLPIDRYDDESIAVHEFCHTIDGTLRSIDATWTERRDAVYQKAMEAGLWKNSYAASHPGEYWAEVVQSYFDCNRVNNWNHGPVGTREQLKVYDPGAYELVRSTFSLKPDQDWRYTWLQPLPNITEPPMRFGIDSFYTKFTYARELPVIGRAASDSAMLKVNDTVRKLFAYRHDILKTLINEGTKVLVLGKEERLAELPELRTFNEIDLLARFMEYSPDHKLIVVGEENVDAKVGEQWVGDNQLIYLLAKAAFEVCASRPVDPNWEDRGRAVQQYELRVRRLDTDFRERLEKLKSEAADGQRWLGTPAHHSLSEYFARGVLAYFDAAGQTQAPADSPFPIVTRELLREYDPALFELVAETFAYESHVDWRYQ